MEAVRRTTSSEGADLDLDGLGDNMWPEAIMDAPSFPTFFASPPIFLSDATAATATTNSCLGQPGVAMASEGAMADVGAPDQLVSGANASAAIASNSTSFFAPPSTFLLDATTNGGAPAASANTDTSSIQPSIPTMSWEGIEIDLDGLGQALLPGDNAWLGAAIDAPSSHSFFASPSIFPSYATTITATTNTCLSQPSITMESEGAMVDFDLDHLLSGNNPWLQVATNASSSTSFFDFPSTFPLPASTNTCLIQPSIPTNMSSQGAGVDLDLLEQPSLYGDNAWPEVAPMASSSTSFFASPSTFPSDAETTRASATPSSANYFIQWTGASSSVRERFMQALTYIRETQRYNTVPVQLWMPYERDGRSELMTAAEPFTVDQSSDRIRFTNVSTRCALPAVPMGLARRVFRGKLPEWSPGVQYLTHYNGSMLGRPQDLGVRGSLVLPVFDKGNYSCLGVIELITTVYELKLPEHVLCLNFRELNLKNTEVSSIPTKFSSIPRTKFNGASYIDALTEILQVLTSACIIHNLPLAQTWATCAQQGKWGRGHSDESYRYCISTIDAACYVNDPQMQIFHEACSEHHLLPGQGVVGRAFTTNQPCFLRDIGTSNEHEYPLSYHAKIFRLKGASAIRLRCTHTGMADFVLEFFLPIDGGELKEQKAVLDSLWGTVRSLSKTLRMVTDKEMEEGMNDINSVDLQKKKPMKRKPMARRSHVWKSFTEVIVGDTLKAKCNYCDLELCCDSKNGTSSLKSHLKRCKLNPDNRITDPL